MTCLINKGVVEVVALVALAAEEAAEEAEAVVVVGGSNISKDRDRIKGDLVAVAAAEEVVVVGIFEEAVAVDEASQVESQLY